MKWTTSCARATSKVASANGDCSAADRRTSTPGWRSRTAATNFSEGSTAATSSGPTRLANSLVRAPAHNPRQVHAAPTARRRDRPAAGKRNRIPAHETVVRVSSDVEAHPPSLTRQSPTGCNRSRDRERRGGATRTLQSEGVACRWPRVRCGPWRRLSPRTDGKDRERQ